MLKNNVYKFLSPVLSVLVCLVSLTPLFQLSAENTALTQGFENFTGCGTTFSVYEATAENDPLVHSGSHSLKWSASSGTKVTSLYSEGFELEVGKEYNVTVWMYLNTEGYSDVTLEQISDPQNGWSRKTENSKHLTGIGTDKLRQWQKVTVTLTAAQKYLGLSIWGAGDVYFDSITVTPTTAPITVHFDTMGGSTVAAVTGVPESVLELPAAPTKDGYYFTGWYTGADCSTPFIDTVFPNSDTTLYARWTKNGTFVQDFESYDLTINTASFGYSIYTAESADDPNVLAGTHSMKKSGTVAASRCVTLINQYATLEVGKNYRFSAQIRIADTGDKPSGICIANVIDRVNFWSGSQSTQLYYVNPTETQPEGFFEITGLFTASAKYFGLSTYGPADFYIDNVEVTEVPTVTISFVTPGVTAPESISGSAGQAVSVPTPTAPEGKSFAGWYLDAECQQPVMVTTMPESDTVYYAKWLDVGTYVQNFEAYDLALNEAATGFSIYTAANEQDPYVYEGTHSLKKSGTVASTKVVTLIDPYSSLQVGKAYRFTARLYVTDTGNSGSGLNFTQLSDRKNPWSYANGTDKQIQYINHTEEQTDDFVEISYLFVAATPYFGLASWGPATYYLDDIRVVEVPLVTITFVTPGAPAPQPISGPAGMAVRVSNPTAPAGKTFAGWYLDAAYQRPGSLLKLPETDTVYYAKWINEGCFEQDFESWPYAQGSNGMSAAFSLYTAKNDQDPNVYSGQHSIHYSGAYGRTYALTLFDPTMSKLEIGEKYYVTVHFKPDKIPATKYAQSGSYHSIYYTNQADNGWSWQSQGPIGQYYAYAFYEQDIGDTYWTGTAGAVTSTTKKDENGWFTMTYEISAATPYIAIYFAGEFSMYIDAITITPLPSGLVEKDYENSYCENFYNVLKNIDFSATAAGKKTVYKLDLDTRGDYVFATGLKNGAKAWLAFDEKGEQLVDGTLFANNGGSVKRFASRVMTDFSGVFYLVIEGSVSKDFDRLILSPKKFATAEDPNPTQVRPAANYSALTVKEAAAENPDYDISLGDGAGNTDGFSSNTPSTGDHSYPALAALLCALAVGVVLTLKGGKKA